MQRLKCCHHEYEWGQTGDKGQVGHLVKIGKHFDGRKDERKPFDSGRPHAELWMGTHQNGPSYIYDAQSDAKLGQLKEFLQMNEQGGYDLPFLFKCLSVQKALSIQTHPNREQAKILHARDPKNYPDDNHKPEMAIAVTEFQMLCGFAPWNTIEENMASFPEVRALAGEHENEDKTKQLEETFSSIWKSSPADISACVEAIITRIAAKGVKSELEQLMIRLNGQFPGGDVGVLAPIFMNYIILKPGEAVYLGANVPHAYLYGDCMECMACSDNTIRAGLTPKFKDVETLCGCMNWTMGAPPFVTPQVEPVQDNARRLYAVEGQNEFMIRKWESSLSGNSTAATLYHPAIGSNSIWIVLEGTGTFVQEGDQPNLGVQAGDIVLKPSSVESILVASPDFLAYSALVPKSEQPSEDWKSPRMSRLATKVQDFVKASAPGTLVDFVGL